MNISVALFFIHNVLATLFIGMKLKSHKDPVFKDFGMGLLLTGVAFAIWTAAVLFKPANLDLFVTVGAFFFIISLMSFLAAGLQRVANRSSLMTVGFVVALLLFILRTFVYPSNPSFSPEGLFFFNVQPIVQILYIFGLALTVLPATYALANKISNSYYSRLFEYGFIIQVMGGILLLTSTNITVLYINGWIIGLTYLVMWTSLLFGKKDWADAK
jgi:hypothetical protein